MSRICGTSNRILQLNGINADDSAERTREELNNGRAKTAIIILIYTYSSEGKRYKTLRCCYYSSFENVATDAERVNCY